MVTSFINFGNKTAVKINFSFMSLKSSKFWRQRHFSYKIKPFNISYILLYYCAIFCLALFDKISIHMNM